MLPTLALYSPTYEALKPEETVLYTVDGLKEPVKANLFLQYEGTSIENPSNPEILNDLSDVVRVGLVSPSGNLICRINEKGKIKTKPFHLNMIEQHAQIPEHEDPRQVAAKSLDDPMTPAIIANRVRILAPTS